MIRRGSWEGKEGVKKIFLSEASETFPGQGLNQPMHKHTHNYIGWVLGGEQRQIFISEGELKASTNRNLCKHITQTYSREGGGEN